MASKGIKLLSLSMAASVAFSTLTPVSGQEVATDVELRGSASHGSDVSSLEGIDRKILAKEMELLRLNAEFRTHYLGPQKWKKRRQKFYDATGGAIANAGDITLMSQFYRYWKNPGDGLAHKGRLEAGPIIVMVAYLTLGGLYAAEGAYDLVSDYRSTRKGMDAHSVYKRAFALKGEMDSLLTERNQTAGGTSQSVVSLAEEKVLRDIRDLALLEFSRVYVDSRKLKATRDLTTLGTIAVCGTGAFPGALGVVRGLRNVNLKQVGGGGIGFLISGSTLTAAPVLIHGGAYITGKISAAKLEKALADANVKSAATLDKDIRSLVQVGGSDNQNYTAFSKLLADRQKLLDKEKNRHKWEVLESLASYAAKGGPQIAFGTMLTRAGYKYYTDPVNAFRGVARSAVVNEVSWGNWMLDVVQKGTRDEIYNFRQGKIAPADAPFSLKNTDLVQLENTLK